MDTNYLRSHIRVVHDFPIKGIEFQDVSTLYKDAECLRQMVDELYERYRDRGITKVVGIESRGFVVGAALAMRLGAGFVMCRKPGKLPAETMSVTYTKEYGDDTVHIHTDAITADDVVLLHDDLLATGGSMRAAYDLVKLFSPKEVMINFIFELTIEGLRGRDAFPADCEISTLLTV